MDSNKTLFALFGGVVLTTVIGFLLTLYKDSSSRKKIAKKVKDRTDSTRKTIKDSVADGKNQLKKMGEDIDRMINEGG